MELKDFFNRRPRTGILCTASKSGAPNMAVINSTRMMDETTIELEIGHCRSLDNLNENPQASFMVVEAGSSLMDWKGIRAYLDLVETHTSGPKLEAAKAELEQRTGRSAARGIKATLVFKVRELRPLVDRGQGWEYSIKDL